MLNLKHSSRRPLLAAAAAALCLPLLGAAPTAAAGDVNWSITVGSGGHHAQRGGGYYRSVWVPPVYRTHYDPCGRARQVCVRAGYYRQVWVAHRPVVRRSYDRGCSTGWTRSGHRGGYGHYDRGHRSQWDRKWDRRWNHPRDRGHSRHWD
jgi:hypothetical protein